MDNYDFDELFDEAAKIVTSEGVGSAALLQRRLKIGWARATRILDRLEYVGVLAHESGNKPRKVIVNSFEEFKKRKLDKRR